MTHEELKQMRELCEAATPGHREVVTSKRSRSKWAKVIVRDGESVCTLYSEWSGANYIKDADFNALFNPTRVLELLSEIELLNKTVEEFKRIYSVQTAAIDKHESQLSKAVEVIRAIRYRYEGNFKGIENCANEFLSQLEEK